MPNLEAAIAQFEMAAAFTPTPRATPMPITRPVTSPGNTPTPRANPIRSVPPLRAKEFSTKTRKKLAKKGHARPDGSYPIETTTDVGNAVKDWYRSHGSPADKAHIRTQAKRLGMSDPFHKMAAGGPGSGRRPGLSSKHIKDIEKLGEKHANSNMYDRGKPLNKEELSRAQDHIRNGRAYYDVDEGRLVVNKSGKYQSSGEVNEQVKALKDDVKESRGGFKKYQ